MLGDSSARIYSRGRNLGRTFHSPIPGIPFQALPKPGQHSWPVPSTPHRSILSSFGTTLASHLLLTSGAVTARRPLLKTQSALTIAHRHLTPLRGFSSPRDQSLTPVRHRKACPNDSPDCPSLPVIRPIESCGPQITVPDPLCFAGLAVPRTSWNHGSK
jgi:hypothetical protein